MIKKYNQFINESILDALKGPSEEELWNNLKDLEPKQLLDKSLSIGFDRGIKYAIENGAKITSNEIYNILEESLKKHNFIMFKFAIDNGVKTESGWGGSLSDIASEATYEMTKYLLSHKNFSKDDLGYCLERAAKRGHTDVVELYLKIGADVNYQDGAALFYAVRLGYYDTVKLLLENGASPLSNNNNDFISEAVKNYYNDRSIDILRLLLDYGGVIYKRLYDLTNQQKFTEIRKVFDEYIEKRRLKEEEKEKNKQEKIKKFHNFFNKIY